MDNVLKVMTQAGSSYQRIREVADFPDHHEDVTMDPITSLLFVVICWAFIFSKHRGWLN